MLLRHARLALALTAAATLTTPLAAQTIDTRGGLPTQIGGYALGGPASNFYFRELGESFIAPVGFSVLQDFSFFVTRSNGGGSSDNDFTFRAIVQAFNGTAPTGAQLYTSPVRTRLATEAIDVVGRETFMTGGLLLTPGASYVAYLQAFGPATDGGRSVSFVDPGLYANGILYANPALDFLTVGQDLAFTATFSAAATTSTPEPGTWLLLGTGLVAIGVTARRRRVR